MKPSLLLKLKDISTAELRAAEHLAAELACATEILQAVDIPC